MNLVVQNPQNTVINRYLIQRVLVLLGELPHPSVFLAPLIYNSLYRCTGSAVARRLYPGGVKIAHTRRQLRLGLICRRRAAVSTCVCGLAPTRR